MGHDLPRSCTAHAGAFGGSRGWSYQAARECGRTLLVLDTRQGDAAERLYRALGYQEAGVIPGYARNEMGTLDGTIFFYKELPLL